MTAAPVGPPDHRLLTPTFLLLTAATLAYFVAIGSLLPTLPRYIEGPLDGSTAAVGIIVGAFGFTAILFRPVAGRYGDRHGRRLLVVGGAVIVAGAVVAYGFAATPTALFGLRLVTGVGEALYFVGAATIVNDLAPEHRRGEAVSIFSVALYGGIALGPILGEQVLAAASFTAVWLASGACAGLGALLALALPETRPPDEHDDVPRSRLIHPAGILPGVVLLTSVLGQVAFHAYVVLHALDIGLAGAGGVYALFATILLVIRSAGARLPDRIGLRRSARTSLVLTAAGLVVIAGWGVPAGLYVGAAIFAVGQALAFPALMAMTYAAAPPAERGSVVATFSAFFDLAFAVGGLVLGAVAALMGYRGPFLAAAVACAVGYVVLRRIPEPEVAPVSEEVPPAEPSAG